MKKRQNILICPLEWGLGHAGRMIALAKKLQERKYNIFIGTGKELQQLFSHDLTGLYFIDFRGFRPKYSKFLPQYAVMLIQLPVLVLKIIIEHLQLKSIIRNHDIDIVISDNRFGLWNRKIISIYVTHQPLIPFPNKFRSLEWIGVMIHRFFIDKYSFCLIPDLPGNVNLTGKMTHGLKLPGNTRFTGILSRFNIAPDTDDPKPIPSFNTLILSGPEPQRTLLREKVTEIMKDEEFPLIILEGKPGNNSVTFCEGNIISYNHLPSSEMQRIITESNLIIARSGYSTLMELISLNRTALLVPTPGQPEQEYLAGYLSAKGWFTTTSQKELSRESLLPGKPQFMSSEIVMESGTLLETVLDEILYQHNKK